MVPEKYYGLKTHIVWSFTEENSLGLPFANTYSIWQSNIHLHTTVNLDLK